jgi:hypothetical protein
MKAADKLKEAYSLGKEAHALSLPLIPARNPKLVDLLHQQKGVDISANLDILMCYRNGWIDSNRTQQVSSKHGRKKQ